MQNPQVKEPQASSPSSASVPSVGKPVHVLHVIQALTLGGAARSMIATSKYSARQGAYKHSIVALHSSEEAAAELARAGGISDIHVAPDDSTLDGLMQAADIVQLHWWNTPETERFLRRDLPPMRLVIWYHVAGDGAPHIITPQHSNMADCNIPCNPFTCNDLPVFRDASPEFKSQRIRMVYDAADFDRLQGGALRAHAGFRVGYIGTVDFFKMHPDYVKMSAAVRVPDVKFVVCGGGKQEILREQAQALQAELRFEFRGYVNDIKSVIEEFDVYGYPLCEHTYAAAELNLQEVMFMGVPPVVFPYGGVKQLVQHEETGLIVHSPQAYSEAIEYLHAKPEERFLLGRNAQAYAASVFGAENAARDLNDAYAMLMQRDKRLRIHGRDAGQSLLKQDVSYYDVDNQTAAPSWEVFVESLGEHGLVFRRSAESDDERELFEADSQISASSALLFDTGIKAYRLHDGEDAVLRFWTGLVLLKQGDPAAASEFAAAYQTGLQHWRVLWYLAQALGISDQKDQADALMRQLRAAIPDIDQRVPQQSQAAHTPEKSSVNRAASTGGEPVDNQSSPAATQAKGAHATHAGADPDPVSSSPRSALESEYLVSAVVSTYASEEFLRGCLEELTGQTLFKQGKLEIIVIDAASPENEAAIVQEYLNTHSHIVFERTPQRESLYHSWNRACRMARGTYIVNANADDRRRSDCFEILAAGLEFSGAGIAYSDVAYSQIANKPFDEAVQGVWRFPAFDPRLGLHYCMGCFSIMWRKIAWEALGGFNAEAYELAADYDFFTRAALQFGAIHVPEAVTMALLHDKQQSKREERMNAESEAIRAAFAELPLYEIFGGAKLDSPAERASAYLELGNAAMTLREPWYGDHQVAIKPQAAARWYQLALAEVENYAPALFNTAILTAIVGKGDVALQLLAQVEAATGSELKSELAAAHDFCSRAGAITMDMLLELPLLPSGFAWPPDSAAEFESMNVTSVADEQAPESTIESVPKSATESVPKSATESATEARSDSVPESSPVSAAATEVQTDTAGGRRVLFTMFGWDESGGGTMFPRSVAEELARRGNNLGVLYAGAKHPQNSQPYFLEYKRSAAGVELFGLFNRPTQFLDVADPQREAEDDRVVMAMTAVLEGFQPEVVHFHNFLGLSFAIARLAHERGIPTVYTPHNYHMIDPALYLINSDLRRWQSTDFLKESELAATQNQADWQVRIDAARLALNDHIDCTIAVSRRVKQLLLDFGAPEDKTFVVHQMPQSTEVILAAATPKQIKHQPLRFGFIGAMIPHKGVHILVQAMQLIPPGAAECWVYGYGSAEYKDALNKIDGKQTIRWQGEYSISDLPQIAAELDAVVIPSVWEECAGLVLAESLSANLPIIASDIGGTPDFVHDGVNGRLYPCDDPQALAAVLLEFVQDAQALLRLANRGVSHRFADYIDHVEMLYGMLFRREPLDPDRVNFKPAINGTVKHDAAETERAGAPQTRSHGQGSYQPEGKQERQPEVNQASRQERREKPPGRQAEQQAGQKLSAEINARMNQAQEIAGGFATSPASGILPDPLPAPLYLNVGCGKDVREGFVNIDLFSDDPRVVAMDVRDLDLPDACADALLASDILEHFSHRETRAVLTEWSRVLKPGGELIIRCPSLRLQVQAYMRGDWDADIASYMIFGGQTNPGDYHCIGFDEPSIRRHLSACGLTVESFEEADTPQDKGFINLNMTVRARKAQLVTTAPPDAELNIAWEGSQFVQHSLALINRQQCLNLIKSGLANPLIIPYENDTFDAGEDKDLLLLKSYDVRHRDPGRMTAPSVWVRHQWPPSADRPQHGKWVINQPWEFSALRRDFVELFNRVDEVWTPSTFCRDVYVKAGVAANKVQVVPNGIDPQLFTPQGPRYELQHNKRFNFLFVGGTIFRKGIDILLTAFARTFNSDDDVCLVIKDMGGNSFYKGQTAREHIDKLRAQPNAPAIEYIDSMLTDAELVSLYRACDVFVTPYRGEGFSLPTLEAMACGLPVIVTAGGATDDFVDESVGWLIPAGTRSIGTAIDGHALSAEAFVLEPDEETLALHMRAAFEEPQLARARGIAAALRARSDWTWNRAGLRMFSRIDALLGTRYAERSAEQLTDSTDAVLLFGRAEQANRSGQVDEAIVLYQQAFEMRGLPEQYLQLTLHRLASYALAADELELATEFLDKSAEVGINSPDTQYLRAILLLYSEEWEDALDLLNPLTEHWKDKKYNTMLGVTLDQLLTEIGRGLLGLDFADDARKMFELALNINSGNADACFGAGMAFLKIEALAEARTMFEWAVKLRPDFAAASEALESIADVTPDAAGE